MSISEDIKTIKHMEEYLKSFNDYLEMNSNDESLVVDEMKKQKIELKKAISEKYKKLSDKLREELNSQINNSTQILVNNGFNEESFLKLSNKIRKSSCAGNKEPEGIFTPDGIIKSATDYNDYLLINTGYLLKLYDCNLFWWQKLIIKLLRFKNKDRRTFEFLYKDEILKDLKEKQNEGFIKYKW